MLREPIAWAGLTFMGWLVALPLSAPAGDPVRVWQPEIERIEPVEGGVIYKQRDRDQDHRQAPASGRS
jgi:hypothetical protein